MLPQKTFIVGWYIHSVDDLSFVQCSRKVSLIGQYQHRDSIQLWLVEQVVKFVLRCFHLILVRGVYHVSTNNDVISTMVGHRQTILKSSDKFLMKTHLRTTGVACHMGSHPMLPDTQHRWTHPTITLVNDGWYSIFLPQMDGRLSWPGWLAMYVPRWFTHPQMVTHPSSKWARRRVTTLIEMLLPSHVDINHHGWQ